MSNDTATTATELQPDQYPRPGDHVRVTIEGVVSPTLIGRVIEE